MTLKAGTRGAELILRISICTACTLVLFDQRQQLTAIKFSMITNVIIRIIISIISIAPYGRNFRGAWEWSVFVKQSGTRRDASAPYFWV